MRMISRFGGKYNYKLKWIWVITLFCLLAICFVSIKLSIKVDPINYISITTANLDENNNMAEAINAEELNILPLEIAASNNNIKYQKLFLIPKDTVVNVYAVGEAANYITNPFLFKSYDNDGVEVYFDLNNERSVFFDLNKDDRQYRILWKTLKIDGQNINKNGMKVSQIDTSPTTYSMSLAFPWKSLGYITPKDHAKFGFDISLIDSDGGTMKSELNWHSKSEDSWKNTSHYGTMELSMLPQFREDSNTVIACFRTPKSILNKKKNISTTQFKNVTIGTVADSLDLSGNFKAEWDMDYLYLNVNIRDNIKSSAQALFDYGWIEDVHGKIIWKMAVDKLQHAGGAFKNQYIKSIIPLKSGFYFLKYQTDESHSPIKWDDLGPSSEFYGIKLSNLVN